MTNCLRTEQIFAYKMVHDENFAPHIDSEGEYLTFATCRNDIRRKMEVDEWVTGVAAKSLKPTKSEEGRAVWAGQVSERLTYDAYYKDPRFLGRADNIYRLINGEYQQISEAKFHKDEATKKHDLTCTNVLVFKKFWYFGGNGPQTDMKVRGKWLALRPLLEKMESPKYKPTFKVSRGIGAISKKSKRKSTTLHTSSPQKRQKPTPGNPAHNSTKTSSSTKKLGS